MTLWVALAALASAVEPCPEGKVRATEAQPECCFPDQTWNGTTCTGIPSPPPVPPPPRPKPVEKRLVLFSGFGGQTLWLDGEEIGRLPTSLELPLGEHTWVVKNAAETELGQGVFRARRGTENQFVVLNPAPREEPDQPEP